MTTYPLEQIKYYHGVENVDIAGINCLVTRTGYTGEDGVELYCKAGEGPALYDAIVENGKDDGLILAGLGCRTHSGLKHLCLYTVMNLMKTILP